MLLDAQKKWHDARESQRKELQELKRKTDDEICKLRRMEGECPMSEITAGDCMNRQINNKCRMQEIASMHAPGTLFPKTNPTQIAQWKSSS